MEVFHLLFVKSYTVSNQPKNKNHARHNMQARFDNESICNSSNEWIDIYFMLIHNPILTRSPPAGKETDATAVVIDIHEIARRSRIYVSKIVSEAFAWLPFAVTGSCQVKLHKNRAQRSWQLPNFLLNASAHVHTLKHRDE